MDGGYPARNGVTDAPQHRAVTGGSTLGEDCPQVCETCLGPNPYVRMSKLPLGQKLCKISGLPYQAFRWKAGPGGRHKETIVSHAVAAERNICQACLNDMVYGLPVGVRDKLLRERPEDQIAPPQSQVGQQYFYEQQQQMAQTGQLAPIASIINDPSNAVPARQLDHFARVVKAKEADSRIAFRNLPKLCSFWLNGSCTRVLRKTCPFRPCCGAFAFPEIAASDKELCDQLVADLHRDGAAVLMKRLDKETRNAFQKAMRGNRDEAIRSRVQGDDVLTRKYLGRMKNMQMELTPPEDQSIVTLWIGNVDADLSESDLRAAMYAYGQIAAMNIVRSSKCAFVEYVDRTAAEHAAKHLYRALIVKGRELNVNWAKPRAAASDGQAASLSASAATKTLPAPPGMENAPSTAYALCGLPPPQLSMPDDTLSGNNSRDSSNITGEIRKLDEIESSASIGSMVSAKRFKAASSTGILPSTTRNSAAAHFAAYGDDSDDDGNNCTSASAAYPAMDPMRMGAKL